MPTRFELFGDVWATSGASNSQIWCGVSSANNYRMNNSLQLWYTAMDIQTSELDSEAEVLSNMRPVLMKYSLVVSSVEKCSGPS